ncbi:IclR family transcriptional regulator [Parasedimentitalea maritima]|uniref:Helix-turn-helix domain-containing protein n=1 Tax=Parasedimentitalea maritima TaxID=2578117 RepID=A0A6A4R9U9_9RHOB|nr:IclR family transcriptional regulator [Zongyanglinia marina]KAE9629385.1 helix-turn-helix domain-containing protein [Zongyanglinia marina]
MTEPNKTKGSSDGTVGKALEILDAVAAKSRPVRFGELLAESPHPKATLYRFLQTLTNQEMLHYDSDQQTYSLGLRLVRMAHSAWSQSSLSSVAAPILDELAAAANETIHLAQMENGQVLFVDKRRASALFETLAQTGRVAPAHSTGVGKAILAFMSPERLERALKQQAFVKYTPNTHDNVESLKAEFVQIRAEGLAYDREEHEQGIISIAAPILLGNGKVVGAVSIASSTSRHSPESLQTFREALLDATARIGNEATPWQFPT